MKKVLKYPIPTYDHFGIELTVGAEILTVQEQLGDAFMWALVDLDAKLEMRRFRFAGTGHTIEENNLKYIGTFQLQNGAFVGHLFEITYV